LRREVLKGFSARTLIGEDRAEAYVVPQKMEFTGDIYRAVLGATIVRVQTPVSQPEMFGARTIITLAPATADAQDIAKAELGRGYELLFNGATTPFWTDFKTDVIRIERFGMDGEVLTKGPVSFQLYAPSKTPLTFFAFHPTTGSAISAPEALFLTDIGGSAVSKGGGWYHITVPTVEYDIAGAEDVDECLSDPCGEHANCANVLGGPAKCSCHPGFVVDDGAPTFACVMLPADYSPVDQGYYLRLYNTDRMDYGWRIRSIAMYSGYDEATGRCSGAMLPLASVGVDRTVNTGGENGDASYVGTTRDSLFDTTGARPNTGTEWWSFGLNLNPEVLDETHGGAQVIEWKVKGTTVVNCVELQQVPGHASQTLLLERGPLDCKVKVGPRCPVTKVWSAESFESGGAVIAAFSTACGVPNTQYFGELLQLPETIGSGWYGSYGSTGAVPVPSVCHCEELCVSLVPDGCRSYRYYAEGNLKHCYIQSNLISKGTGYWGTEQMPGGAFKVGGGAFSWTSGTPGRRVLSFSPSVAFPGEPFSLTVQGVGFPYSTDKSTNLGPRQRLKLVPAGKSCEVKVPSEVKGIGCTKTMERVSTGDGMRERVVYVVCNPRPASSTAEMAEFGPITVAATAFGDSVYDVCYCATACHDRMSWEKVAGSLTVAKAEYAWTVTPSPVPRKLAGPVVLSVTRPPFGTFTNAAEWRVKIVRDHFGCGVCGDPSKFAFASLPAPVATGNGTVSQSIDCGQPGDYIAGPDTVTWTYTVTADMDDVGTYLVCFAETAEGPFKPILGMEKEPGVEVALLEADRAHPRGIFHNHAFSLLAGSSSFREFAVGGTGLPYPSDSRLLLNKNPTCGDAATYMGVPLTTSAVDTVAPYATYDNVYPPPSTTLQVSTTQQIRLSFNEAVTNVNCFGNFTFVSLTGGTSYRYPCEDMIPINEKVILRTDFSLGSDQYYIRIETGGLTDLSGNALPILLSSNNELVPFDTAGTYIIDTTSDTTAPAVLGSSPCDGCTSGLVVDTGNGTFADRVELYLSEDVSLVAGKFVKLYDCGADLVCGADDVLTVSFVVGNTNQARFYTDGVLTLDFGLFTVNQVGTAPTLTMGRRYKLEIEADMFVDSLSATGPAQKYVMEFTKAAVDFDYKVHSATATALKSSSDGLTFDLKVPASTAPGVYTACYCNEQTDKVLLDAGDGETTYILEDDKKMDPGYVPMDVVVVDLSVEDHRCYQKCADGCTGPYCYCEGFEKETMNHLSKTLCLPPGLCREVCDAESSTPCAGISVHDTLPQCLLYGTGANGTVPTSIIDESWQTYVKTPGRVCSELTDFTEVVGTVDITSRAMLEVDYVVEPGSVASIEVVSAPGESLTYLLEAQDPLKFLGDNLLSSDRIAVVDGYGSCGISPPTDLVALPNKEKPTLEDWMAFTPYSWFREVVSEDQPGEGPNVPDPDKIVEYVGISSEKEYAARRGYYCPGRNMDLDTLTAVFQGVAQSVKVHQCYTKCELNAPGDQFCDGYYSGFDSPDSNAICGDVQLCQYICDQFEGCGSIDMHMDKPRCFLNLVGCATHTDQLYVDPSYAVLFKRADGNDEQAGGAEALEELKRMEAAQRRLDGHALPLPGTPATYALGFSWAQMLRFKGMTFSSGGRFKVCFCDSTIHSSCLKPSDYGVELGEVHVSGVSCLVENPRLRRVACAEQYHGGLRCYADMREAPMPTEPPVGMTELPSEDVITPLSLATKCASLPIDEAEHDPRCAAVLASIYA